MKKLFFILVLLCLNLTACGEENTLFYGSENYTRINPAMDERSEIDLLLFDGLTDHDEMNQIIPRLAERWDYEEATLTYTFYLVKNVEWHDGEPFTAEDVKFTFEAIMDETNGSCHASDYAEVAEITVLDKYTVSFRLSAVNAAFLDYMTMPILPKHCLEEESWQDSEFFLAPVGTGPYMLDEWEKGKSIILERNEDYFAGPAKLEEIVFRIIADEEERAEQLLNGNLDLARIAPRDAECIEETLTLYPMTTAGYCGILYNFRNRFWQFNGDLIPALSYAVDRQKMVEVVLLGYGEAAYSPLQRNKYDSDETERFDYDPDKARELLDALGCELDGEGYWSRNGHRISFVINADAGDAVQVELAEMAAQQLRDISLDVRAQAVSEELDWYGQQCCIIGRGSYFDADDQTYKVFVTGGEANASGYSDARTDAALMQARRATEETERALAYEQFQYALTQAPACTFLCYADALYGANPALGGIATDMVLGYNGVGIFRNVCDWTKGK